MIPTLRNFGSNIVLVYLFFRTSLISAASQLPKFNARSSIGHFFSRYRNFFVFTWRWWWRIGIFNAMLKLLLIEMVNDLIKIHYYGCCSNKHKWYASLVLLQMINGVININVSRNCIKISWPSIRKSQAWFYTFLKITKFGRKKFFLRGSGYLLKFFFTNLFWNLCVFLTTTKVHQHILTKKNIVQCLQQICALLV